MQLGFKPNCNISPDPSIPFSCWCICRGVARKVENNQGELPHSASLHPSHVCSWIKNAAKSAHSTDKEQRRASPTLGYSRVVLSHKQAPAITAVVPLLLAEREMSSNGTGSSTLLFKNRKSLFAAQCRQLWPCWHQCARHPWSPEHPMQWLWHRECRAVPCCAVPCCCVQPSTRSSEVLRSAF